MLHMIYHLKQATLKDAVEGYGTACPRMPDNLASKPQGSCVARQCCSW